MNRDNVIRIAQEAGLVRFEGGELEAYGIAKASLDDHSRACWSIADEQRLTRFAELIEAAEREACANLLLSTDLSGLRNDLVLQNWTANLLANYAAAIRARGQG